MIIPLLGYYEFLTHRNVMVDMPTHHDPLEKVPLDGVVSVVKKGQDSICREEYGLLMIVVYAGSDIHPGQGTCTS